MKKLSLWIYMVVFLSVCFLSGCRQDSAKGLRVKDCRIKIELADTQEKRVAGLMFRASLPEDSGMLFIFDEEADYGFWMKNMIIPLDMIWIDSKKIIVDITKNALPCKEECLSIHPKRAAKYVLEVNSGYTDAHNINVGDKVEF